MFTSPCSSTPRCYSWCSKILGVCEHDVLLLTHFKAFWWSEWGRCIWKTCTSSSLVLNCWDWGWEESYQSCIGMLSREKNICEWMYAYGSWWRRECRKNFQEIPMNICLSSDIKSLPCRWTSKTTRVIFVFAV